MAGSTILGAEQVIATRLGGFEPDRAVLARHDIHLHAKRRDKKTVNHIFGGHRKLDPATDWNVQLIDLALAVQVLKLPHPLLADDIDVERLAWRVIDGEIEARSPDENSHRDEERDDAPHQFENHRPLNRAGYFAIASTPELDGEVEYQQRDDNTEQNRKHPKKPIQRIDAPRITGSLIR